jgi:uroporphyrinogen-III synthase
MRLLVTRSIEDAEPLAAALEERGDEAVLEPLMSITDVAGAAGVPDLDLDGAQALLITSANGIRAFARRHARRDIAVFAVGDASARTAVELGFAEVRTAAGDVDALAALVSDELDPARGTLVHIAGSHVAGDLSGLLKAVGFDVQRRVFYQATAAVKLSPVTVDELKSGTLDGVLLFSPRTAGLFVKLAAAAGLEEACRPVVAYCLSQAVADNAKALPWGRVIVASEPNQRSLLDALGPRK